MGGVLPREPRPFSRIHSNKMMNNSEISNFPAEKKFLIAAVVGSAFVVLASVAPQQSEDLFWMLARVLGTFVSLLVMIMYAASIYKDPVSGEEQADGFYYLGFTFTLVALVAAAFAVPLSPLFQKHRPNYWARDESYQY